MPVRAAEDWLNAMPAVKFRVLLVDDEDDFREILKERLQIRKFVVNGVRSGEEALDILENLDFDVIVLDIRMPGMNGLECLKQIKQMKPLVEVILLTGHSTVQLGIEGMLSGAFEHVLKPVPMEELLEKMELAYERKLARERSAAVS